jgi:AcrR family transcriptional regulator
MRAEQRREREVARAREGIVEAAMRAFARSGLQGTTMHDIACEAGYTAASLYTYFKSKQEIVEAMSNHLTDEYLQVFEDPMPSGLSFRQRFELLLHRHLQVADKRRNLFPLLSSDDPCPRSPQDQLFHANFERRIAGLADWLGRNAKPQDLAGYDAKIVARLVFGMAFGLFHQFSDQGGDSFLSCAPIITEFLFHGISSKPGARKK